jgi:hypothetical protein
VCLLTGFCADACSCEGLTVVLCCSSTQHNLTQQCCENPAASDPFQLLRRRDSYSLILAACCGFMCHPAGVAGGDEAGTPALKSDTAADKAGAEAAGEGSGQAGSNLALDETMPDLTASAGVEALPPSAAGAGSSAAGGSAACFLHA